MCNSRMSRQRGLTLIELLVAISVLAFVAVLGWRGLDSIVRARVALSGDLEQTRGMQLAFAQLQNDCAALAAAAALQNRAALAVEPGRLTLVRTVFAENQPSRLQVIDYRIRQGLLMRHESVATRDLKELDSLWLAAANDAERTQPVVLQADVNGMTLRLWDGAVWRDSAPAAAIARSASSGATPPASGLEITLQLQGREAGMRKVFLLGAI